MQVNKVKKFSLRTKHTFSQRVQLGKKFGTGSGGSAHLLIERILKMPTNVKKQHTASYLGLYNIFFCSTHDIVGLAEIRYRYKHSVKILKPDC